MEVHDVTKPVHFQWATGWLSTLLSKYPPAPTKQNTLEVKLLSQLFYNLALVSQVSATALNHCYSRVISQLCFKRFPTKSGNMVA